MLNQIPAPDDAPQTTAATVLIVDDSRAQLMLLTRFLRKMGLTVRAATSGEVALHICQFEKPDLIISDWVMPGMDGLEFCKAFRAMQRDRYGYFILQTSNDEKHEVARGLDTGADDLLTKPVNASELRARVRAGLRVLSMERELTEKNRLIGATLDEMKALHALIDHDLVEAQKLQHSLVPDRHRRLPGMDVSLLLRSAGRVGGDLVGMFEVNANEIGVFALDVSGHGIASALMTARLAAYFSGRQPEKNIAIAPGPDGPVMRRPSETVALLNRLVLDDMDTEQYLTIALARVEVATGRVTLTQAGHPHPLVHRKSGAVDMIGHGGMPVGLLPVAEFEDVETVLAPGDRLFIGSDGITECMSPDGRMLDNEGLIDLMHRHRATRGEDFFAAVLSDLTSYCGKDEFGDDVSAVLLDYYG